MDDHYGGIQLLRRGAPADIFHHIGFEADAKLVEPVDGTGLLATLGPVYSSARPQIMRSSVVSSLSETLFLMIVTLDVTPDTTTSASD